MSIFPLKENFPVKREKCFHALMTCVVLFVGQCFAAGTWTRLANVSPDTCAGQMNLLSDGSVMIKTTAGGGDGIGNVWIKLSPDIHGSYITATFSETIPAMHYTRYAFSSQLLRDGRLYVAGGEYGTGGYSAEIYDPLTNLWTSAPEPGALIYDACSEMLPDGRVLQALVGTGRRTVIYDPLANTYSTGALAHGGFDEATWVKLQDNSILQVDFASKNSERYIPSLNSWVVDAALPVDLYDSIGSEMGAGFLLPDKRAFFLGSPGTTAYYSPSGNETPGTWEAGPTIPNAQGTPDAPAAMMNNGKILCAVSPVPRAFDTFPIPISFYEFDYLANSFARAAAPGGGLTRDAPTFVATMLDLPDGRILYGEEGGKTYYVYTPDGAPLASGKPAIGAIKHAGTDCLSGYTVTGTLFNGISEGAAFGDDDQMATNFPIVRLTTGSDVYFARTFNWNVAGVARGSLPDTAEFTLPANLPKSATYSLTVSANGISSDPVSFVINCGAISAAIPESKDLRRGLLVSASGGFLKLCYQLPVSYIGPAGAMLRLIMANGKIVHQEKVSGGGFARQIDIGAFGKGVYIIILKNSCRCITQPIVVM